MNDQAERTVPIQGGAAFWAAWDNRQRTHDTVGELDVALLHPKQLAPQPGIYTGIEDMDWIIVRQPTTKEAIRRQYGVDVENEGEQEPEVRGHRRRGHGGRRRDGVHRLRKERRRRDRPLHLGQRHRAGRPGELPGKAGPCLRPLRPGAAPAGADHPEPAGRGPGSSGGGSRGGGPAADRRAGPGYADGGGCGCRSPRGHGSPVGGRDVSGAAGGRAGAVRRRAVPLVREHGMDHERTGL